MEEGNETQSGYLLDFALMRSDGPGRGSRTQPISDFALRKDEGFCEETAGYYDKASGFLMLQYNFRGPKARQIEAYFSQFATSISSSPKNTATSAPPAATATPSSSQGGANSGFTLAPVLTSDSLARLNQKQLISSLEFTISVPGIAAAPAGQSLSSMLNSPVTAGAEHISMKLSAGRARGASLAVQEIKNFIGNALALSGDVSNLKVRGRDHIDAPSEPLDFIAERLEKEFNVEPDFNSRRLSRNDRWSAVSSAFQDWSANNALR